MDPEQRTAGSSKEPAQRAAGSSKEPPPGGLAIATPVCAFRCPCVFLRAEEAYRAAEAAAAAEARAEALAEAEAAGEDPPEEESVEEEPPEPTNAELAVARADDAQARVDSGDVSLTPRVLQATIEAARFGVDEDNLQDALAEEDVESWNTIRTALKKLSAPNLMLFLRFNGLQAPPQKDRRVDMCISVLEEAIRKARDERARELRLIAKEELRLVAMPGAATQLQTMFRSWKSRREMEARRERRIAKERKVRTATKTADNWRRIQAPRDSCVVWLHGQGETEVSWQRTLKDFEATEEAGNVRWLWPRAQVSPCTSRAGVATVQWFDTVEFPVCKVVRGVPDRPRHPEEADQVSAAVDKVHAVLDALLDEGFNPARILLGGFGQGAALAAHAALRYHVTLCGVALIAAWVPLVQELESLATAAGRECAFLWCHGALDMMIKPDVAVDHVRKLENLGVEVERRFYPEAGFGTNAEILHKVKTWISDRLHAAAIKQREEEERPAIDVPPGEEEEGEDALVEPAVDAAMAS